MPDSIKLKEATTLKRQSNLGEDVEDVAFEAGRELAVLREWETAYLVKDEEGRLYNVKKELVG